MPTFQSGRWVNTALKTITAYLLTRVKPNGTEGFHYDHPYQLIKTSYDDFSRSIYALAQHYSVHPGQEFAPETIVDPIPYLGKTLEFTQYLDDTQFAITNVLALAEELARRVL